MLVDVTALLVVNVPVVVDGDSDPVPPQAQMPSAITIETTGILTQPRLAALQEESPRLAQPSQRSSLSRLIGSRLLRHGRGEE